MDYLTSLVDDIRMNWLTYASMPFIAALIGYLTKLVAVEMLYRPIEFRGIGRIFGWQGIIPRYAPRMAETMVDLMLARLISPQELVDKIDPEELVRRVEKPLIGITDELTRELMAKYQPTLWESLPEFSKKLVIGRVQAQAPKIIKRMVLDLRADIDKVFDIRAMAITTLTKDKALLVSLVREIGKAEMRFIVRCGLVFGFALGFAQVLIWSATHQEWLMPAFGFFIGYFTDWLALQLIFRPIEPKRIFGMVIWQGLFHKRREEVAADYGNLLASQVLTPANVMEAMLTGPQSDQLFALIDKEAKRAVDEQVGITKPIVVLAIGGAQFQDMRRDAVQSALERLPQARHEVEGYAMEALNVQNMVVSKMKLMTSEEYEGLLRPAFKQDEWKLVLIGGVLGGFIGELQVLLLLH